VVVARIEACNHESRALLLRNGFRTVGIMREVGRKFGRWLDVEVFELHLGDAANPVTQPTRRDPRTKEGFP
jgi:phosphinothricin acetyltransferase